MQKLKKVAASHEAPRQRGVVLVIRNSMPPPPSRFWVPVTPQMGDGGTGRKGKVIKLKALVLHLDSGIFPVKQPWKELI